MKRRQFITTAALTAIGASIAPQILKGQDPYEKYAKMEAELTEWYVTPRLVEHTQENNFWQLIQMCSSGEAMEFVDPPEEWDMSGSGVQVVAPGYYHMSNAVCLRDYYNVYEYRGMRGINGHWWWMNVDDYLFYQRLYGLGVFDFNTNRLMGCVITPGLVDPFDPCADILKYRSEAKRVYPVIPERINVIDSYEIHIMWRKR